jgi:hypothetical protein
VYVVTDVGSISTNWILTRASDADTYVIDSPDGLSEGSTFFVQQGTTGAGETYTCNTSGTIIFGTTNITFAQVSSAQIYSAGTGLTLAGTQFSISNTTVTPAAYGSASKTLTATVNAQGQLTALADTNIAIQMSQVTSGTLPVTQGGTGFSSYAIGDIIYADTTTSFAKLGAVATGSVLISNGLTAAPSWSSSISLTGSVSAATATITANTSSDAFKITQTGTGNAFVVEDSSSPDATPFVIDANGLVKVGIDSNLGSGMNYALQIGGTTSDPGIGLARFSTTGNSVFALARSRNTTAALGAVVQSGDILGQIVFRGDDGAAWKTGAQILAQVDGTPGTNDMPGRLVFSTTADGASTPTERMRITSAGNVGIGTASPTNALDVVATEPFVKISTSSSGLSAFYQATNPLGSLYLGKDRDGSSGLFGSNGEYVIGCTGNYPLDFWTNTVKRMTIAGNGAVNINAPLTVQTGVVGPVLSFSGAGTPFGMASGVLAGANALELTTADTSTTQATRMIIRGGVDNADIEFYRGARTAEVQTLLISGTTGYITNTVKGPGLVQSQLFYALQADYVGTTATTAQAMFGVGAPVVTGTE